MNTVQTQQHDHLTALLHYGGSDAATLRYCPDAVTLLLLECLFHEVLGLILVDVERKILNKN